MANFCSVSIRVDGDELDVHEFIYAMCKVANLSPDRSKLSFDLDEILVFDCSAPRAWPEDAAIVRSITTSGWCKWSFKSENAPTIFKRFPKLTFIVQSAEEGNGVYDRDVFSRKGHFHHDLHSLREDDLGTEGSEDDDGYCVFDAHPYEEEPPTADKGRYKHPIFLELLRRDFGAVRKRIADKAYNPRVTQGKWTPAMVAAHLGEFDLVDALQDKEYLTDDQHYLMRNIVLTRHLEAVDDRWLPMVINHMDECGCFDLLNLISKSYDDGYVDVPDPRITSMIGALLDHLSKQSKAKPSLLHGDEWSDSAELFLYMLSSTVKDKLDAWLDTLDPAFKVESCRAAAVKHLLHAKTANALSYLDKLPLDQQREAVIEFLDSISPNDATSYRLQPTLLALDLRYDDLVEELMPQASMLADLAQDYALARLSDQASSRMKTADNPDPCRKRKL